MHAYDIRKQSKFEELDYIRLKSILRNYAQPRNKIRNLLKNKDLIRVKKGLYIFGPKIAFGTHSKEHLANLIYGPSAISLEYALSFYEMIPEKVTELTSITLKKSKLFETPAGRFSYQHISNERYSYGITQKNIAERNILIAIPEKALCDMLVLKASHLRSRKNFLAYLYENLRVEEESIAKLNLATVHDLLKVYQHPNIEFLYKHLQELKDASSH